MKTKTWTMTNGLITMDVCPVCGQPYREGHVDCSCPQNHPERCERPSYDQLAEQVATKPDARQWPNVEGQCTCGHAADRHGLDAICNEDCPCTGYESWVTPEMALANSRRISGENADLFAIANKAVEEVRTLAAIWDGTADVISPSKSIASVREAATVHRICDDLEAIVQRFDLAIKEQIK